MSLFGLSLGLGFLVSSFLLWRQARREAYNEEKIIDVMLLSIFFGALSGRNWYILSHFSQFGFDFGRGLLFIKYPGFALEGIILGVALVLLGYARQHKENFWTLADLFAEPVTVLTFFGYAGQKNFLLAALFIVLLMFQIIINHSYRTIPEWRKIFDRPGLVSLAYLAVATHAPIPTLATLIIFLVRYQKFTSNMIKFPPKVLTNIKKYLEDRRQKAEHQLAELKKEDPFEDKSRLLDQAANDSEANQKSGHERTQALINQMNGMLIEIRKALTKIKIGNYGTCEKCGKMIDTDRLAAIPTATLCVSCAKKK